MNREIKFRAWENGRMYNDLAYITMQGRAMSLNPEVPLIRPVLMQFTGLKDKNGVEICEGDILTLHRHPSSRTVMAWKKEGRWTDFWPLEEFVVIGNVFENPELLEGK